MKKIAAVFAVILTTLVVLLAGMAPASAQEIICTGPICEAIKTFAGPWFGLAAFVVLFFDRLAKLTPTTRDDGAISWLYRFFAVLGAKVKDNPGAGGK